MALTGIQIYKLLPKTNCRDCGFPTCLAFSMKLAAKQVELSACPHVSDEAKAELAESAVPPIRLVGLKADGITVQAGNETVLFRHEKTFYHKPGLFVRLRDDLPLENLNERAAQLDALAVNYVGIDLHVDGFALESVSGDPAAFSRALRAIRVISRRPFILISPDPAVIAAGLQAVDGEYPLVYAANGENWEALAGLARQHEAALAVTGDSLDELADLCEKIKALGLEDLVLDPGGADLAARLARSTQIRRLALKNNFRPLGYPIITLAGDPKRDPDREGMLAAQSIAKYSGFVVLDSEAPDLLYPLLVLRENIYTDPQKPIQVQPGIYEINNPGPGDPVLVTTNFSITYFAVANEVESAGMPAWLLVCDAEGMSVLTAWAAGNFDAERIARDAKTFEITEKVDHRRLIIPGHVAVISGELEEELPGWDIRVGPREAVDLPRYIKEVFTHA